MNSFVILIIGELIIVWFLYMYLRPKKHSQTDANPEDGSVDPDAVWELGDIIPLGLAIVLFVGIDVLYWPAQFLHDLATNVLVSR